MYPILERHPELTPYINDIDLRMDRYFGKRSQLLQGYESLADFANAHRWYGFHHLQDG